MTIMDYYGWVMTVALGVFLIYAAYRLLLKLTRRWPHIFGPPR